MNTPPRLLPLLAALAGIALSTPALAVVTIDYVTVGNAGNPADTRVMNDGTSGYHDLGKLVAHRHRRAGANGGIADPDWDGTRLRADTGRLRDESHTAAHRFALLLCRAHQPNS